MRRLLLRRLHRWVGGCAALFAILFAVTGLALNHTERLGLQDRRITWAPVARLYGLRPPLLDTAWPTARGQLIAVDGRLFLAGRPLAAGELPDGRPVGAWANEAVLAVAWPTRLLLFDLDAGLPLDSLGPAAGLPVPVDAVGTGADALRLRAAGSWYRADAALLGFEPAATPGTPARMEPPAAQVAEQVRAAIGPPGPDAERFLLDLHSGRLPGAWGVLLADLMALSLTFLAVTGAWMLLRRR